MPSALSEANPVEVRSRKTGELFTVARLLTEGSGITDFSVIHEILHPGHRTASPHFHSKQDELYFILSGSPTVRMNDEKMLAHAGSYVIFKSGSHKQHVIVNDTETTVELLKISSCHEDDVVTY